MVVKKRHPQRLYGMATCEDFSPWYDGEVSSETASAYEVHLAGCQSCQELFRMTLVLDACAESYFRTRRQWWRRLWRWVSGAWRRAGRSRTPTP